MKDHQAGNYILSGRAGYIFLCIGKFPCLPFPCFSSVHQCSQEHFVLYTALPTVSWAHPHQSSVKKMHHRLAHRPIWKEHFLNKSPFFPNDSNLCHVDTKLANTWGDPLMPSGHETDIFRVLLMLEIRESIAWFTPCRNRGQFREETSLSRSQD